MKKSSLYSAEHAALSGLFFDLRIKAELSQAEVASALGRPQTYVSAVELGDRGLELAQIKELAEIYGLSLVEFVTMFEIWLAEGRQRPARLVRADSRAATKKKKAVKARAAKR